MHHPQSVHGVAESTYDSRLDFYGAWPPLEGDPDVRVSVPLPSVTRTPLLAEASLACRASLRRPHRSGAFQRGNRDRNGDYYVLPYKVS